MFTTLRDLYIAKPALMAALTASGARRLHRCVGGPLAQAVERVCFPEPSPRASASTSASSGRSPATRSGSRSPPRSRASASSPTGHRSCGRCGRARAGSRPPCRLARQRSDGRYDRRPQPQWQRAVARTERTRAVDARWATGVLAPGAAVADDDGSAAVPRVAADPPDQRGEHRWHGRRRTQQPRHA